MTEDPYSWYLIRTKPGKERSVCNQLSTALPEAFLPLLRTKVRTWGRLIWSVVPLFPCYLFGRFPLQSNYFDVKYMQGVRGLVSAGDEPLVVPQAIIDEIKRRGVCGVVEIKQKPFASGERVRVEDGPFRGFEAIFERYLSSAERVAILLSAIEASGVRVILPASAVARDT
jgi:transcriptional antiterminator RfaH